MSQMSFGDAEYAGKRKKTRREVFLEEMDQVVPWKSLLALIEPCYPMAGRGRHPYPLETMLRVHLMQNWFGLSDPAMEEALYEITPMRAFAGLTLTKAIPDETTILNFRHLLEANELAPEILSRVNAYLSRKGLMLKRGSIVDATIIAAPSSTKNAEGERDPGDAPSITVRDAVPFDSCPAAGPTRCSHRARARGDRRSARTHRGPAVRDILTNGGQPIAPACIMPASAANSLTLARPALPGLRGCPGPLPVRAGPGTSRRATGHGRRVVALDSLSPCEMRHSPLLRMLLKYPVLERRSSPGPTSSHSA